MSLRYDLCRLWIYILPLHLLVNIFGVAINAFDVFDFTDGASVPTFHHLQPPTPESGIAPISCHDGVIVGNLPETGEDRAVPEFLWPSHF